jgi:hypothetical protein
MKDDTAPFQDVFRQQAILDLEALEKQFSTGDDFALLLAIRKCANFDMVMPDWVARNFIRRFDQVLSCRVGSWDEAFGQPYPGKHLKGLRRNRELRFAIWVRIRKIRRRFPAIPIDERLFGHIGKKFGIQKTKVGELYYQADRMVLKPASAKS